MRKNSFGFTLVELIIVVLIIGILSAIVIPAVNTGLHEMKLDAASREVVSAIQYVQSLATKEGVVYGVRFNKALNQFNCYKIAPGITIINPFDKNPYVVDLTTEGHLEGVNITSATFGLGSNFVSFNSIGEPSAGGSIVLTYGSSQKTINVSLPIGKVTVN